MTIAALRSKSTRPPRRVIEFREFHLTKTTREFDKLGGHAQPRPTRSAYRRDRTATTRLAVDTELSILRDVFRMLPAGVTVQDEQGRFLLVNDAAAAQLGIAAGEPAATPSKELNHRRETGLELLRAGRAAVAEEFVDQRRGQAGLSHRPSPGSHRRPQSAAFELGRHQRAKGRRGSSVPLGLL